MKIVYINRSNDSQSILLYGGHLGQGSATAGPLGKFTSEFYPARQIILEMIHEF